MTTRKAIDGTMEMKSKWRRTAALVVTSASVMIPFATKADAVRVYDADDYVQSGTGSLLMQLDGVRNAGMAVAHDPSAATWTDLTGNLTLTKSGNAGFSNDAWVADGLASYFSTSSDAVKDAIKAKAFTVEMVVSHPVSQNAYEFWLSIGNHDTKRELVVDLRNADSKNALVQGVQYKENTFVKSRCAVAEGSVTQWGRRQYIAVVCDPDGATTYCDGTNRIHHTAGGGEATTLGDIWIGRANNSSERYLMNGSEICAMRMTSRALTADELMQNSKVDLARFRDGAAIGVGDNVANVIVASDVDGLEGNEESGNYYASNGDMFTAPATVLSRNIGYAVAGYTLETWDDANSAWGAAVTNSGAIYTATGSGLVRLTWLWDRVLIPGAALDVGDYVQDGLVAHFDGIRNDGVDAAHNADASMWKNLVEGGPDMAFVNSPGVWTNGNAYCFKRINGAYGQLSSGVVLGQCATIQLAVDVSADEQYPSASYPYYFDGPTDGSYSLSLFSRNQEKTVSFRGCNYFGNGKSENYRPEISNWGGKYLTAMLGDSNVYAFEGIEYENAKARTANASSLPEFQYMFGGIATAYRAVKGKYYNIKLYNRALSEAELRQNRRVDEMRFHGNGDVTILNGVVGESETTGESSLPDGVYNIETGTWTVTAQAIRLNGRTYMPRLLVETCDAATGEWSQGERIWTDSYTVDKSALGDIRICLTWTWEARRGLIVTFH